jgi:VCBS repeat-containing protein
VALTSALSPGGGPAHGALTLNTNGSFTYTPTAGYVGADKFTYVASDSLRSGAPTTVSLAVNAGLPTGRADSYAAYAGQTLTVGSANGVLANDSDPNGQTLSAALAPGGGPAHGALTLNVDGSFTYKATLGYAGADSFSYIAKDAAGSSIPTTVSLSVAARAPTATADSYSATAGQTLTVGAAAGVLANDSDPNSLPMTSTLSPGGGPAHGALTLNTNGSFTYTPTAGYVGADKFTYISSDSLRSGAPTTVNLTVTAGRPTGAADSYAAHAGQALTVGVTAGVLANDSDPNGRSLTAALAVGGAPAHGSLMLNANGAFVYTPTAGFTGTDSFIYIASDGLGSSAQTAVTLRVSASPPVTHADSYGAFAGQSLNVTGGSGVLANDSDPNGLTLSAALAPGGGPAHGALTLNVDGSFTYKATLGYAGADSFSYTAKDAAGSSIPTTVSLSVAARAPTSTADSYSATAGQTLTVGAAGGVLANDSDPNGVALTSALSPGGGPAHGALTLNTNGSFTYTPTAGYVGADKFTYISSDSLRSGSPTTVNLTVKEGLPTGRADTYAAHAGQTLTIAAEAGVLANDTDPNGLALSATVATGGGPSHGTLTLNANGAFVYTPTLGYAGTDSFHYTPGDDQRTGAATTVTLNVAATPPTSQAEIYSTPKGQVLTVAAGKGLLANDTDANGLHLTAALVSGGGPAHGALSLNADGSFTYTPTAGYSGTDSFIYRASDSLSAGSPTTVALQVTAPSAPTAQADSYSLLAGHALTIAAANGVLANDTDPAQAPLNAVIAPGGGPSHGVVTLSANGAFVYIPTKGFFGTDGFNYLASDGGTGVLAHVALSVAASPPTTLADVYTVAAGATLSVGATNGLLANDVGLNGAALTASLSPTGAAAHGRVLVNADGSFTYTPFVHLGSPYVGIDSFTYIAKDGIAGPVSTKVDIFSGGGHPVLNFTTGVDTLTGVADGSVFVAAKGQLQDPATSHGLLDTITNFSGSSDFLLLRGFTSAATVTYEHDLASDPHAHVYLITDGAYHAEFVLDYPETVLLPTDHHWYGFLGP